MDKRLKELSDYRLEQAERCIKSARLLVADDDYKGADHGDVVYDVADGYKSLLELLKG